MYGIETEDSELEIAIKFTYDNYDIFTANQFRHNWKPALIIHARTCMWHCHVK